MIKAFLLFLVCLAIGSCASSKDQSSKTEKKSSSQSLTETKELDFAPGPNPNPAEKEFVEKAKEYGLAGEEATQLYAVDFNDDGYTDLVTLPKFYSIPRFFRYLPQKKRFSRVEEFPFKEKIRASYLGFFDFDGDGVLDVLLGTLNQKSKLREEPFRIYRGVIKKENGAVHYRLKKEGLNVDPLPVASVAVVDVNLDGLLDIYMGNWYNTRGNNTKIIADKLFLGKKDFQFKEVSNALKNENEKREDRDIYLNAVPSFGVSTCDINLDGYPDILVSASSGHHNKLWINRESSSGRYFEDYGEQTKFGSDGEGKLLPRGGGNSFYSACADYNNDGLMDIAVGELSHAYDNDDRDRSAILTGKKVGLPPEFVRSEYYMEEGSASWNQGDRRGVFFDYNRDGLADLVVDNSGFPPKSRLILFKQLEDHSYNNVAKNVGINHVNPSGTIVMDVNRDGRQDIVSGQTNIRRAQIPRRLYLYENQTSKEGKRSLRFILKGDKANTRGIGATVSLQTDEWLSRRWNHPHYGPLPSQNERGVQFAFRENNRPHKVEVIWPALKQKGKNEKGPFSVLYSVKDIFAEMGASHLLITLCENGKWFKGDASCASSQTAK